jgi:hypothetical protein
METRRDSTRRAGSTDRLSRSRTRVSLLLRWLSCTVRWATCSTQTTSRRKTSRHDTFTRGARGWGRSRAPCLLSMARSVALSISASESEDEARRIAVLPVCVIVVSRGKDIRRRGAQSIAIRHHSAASCRIVIDQFPEKRTPPPRPHTPGRRPFLFRRRPKPKRRNNRAHAGASRP